MSRRHRLEKIGSEEGAREILQRMIAAGQLTIDDLDTPSNHWQENYDIALKHYPAVEHPTHRNLLRDIKPTEHVEITSPRDFDARQVSSVRAQVSQVFRHKEESLCAEISERRDQEEQLPGELPF